jgi:flagellar hook assembly protein FlgD
LAKPNPLNPSTVLEFSVAKTGPVRVQIFNAAGRLVKALYEGTLQEGRNTLGWDGSTSTGSRVASGMYYFRIVTAETSEVVRVTVLK